MPSTQDYEFLLDFPNVRAVEWRDDEEKLYVRVTKKLPDEELEVMDNVKFHVFDECEVIDECEDVDDDAAYEFLDTTDRHRPVEAGVSEIHHDATAGTAGFYPAKVVNATNGRWSDKVKDGDYVRLSNNHVYAAGDAEFGDPIWQPSPFDGGSESDETGLLAGYVPFEDGVTVDVAGRTVSEAAESADVFDAPYWYNSGLYEGDYDELKGKTLGKVGRTTGFTTGEVQNTAASVDVRMADGSTIRFRDVMITEDMGDGGDSGSPAFLDGNGELVGKLFAGSHNSTIFCKARNIKHELGIEYVFERDDDDTDNGDNDDGGDDENGGGGDGDDDNGSDNGSDPGEDENLFERVIRLILEWLFGRQSAMHARAHG